MNLANKWLIGLTTGGLISGAVLLEGDYNKYLDPYKDIGGIPTVCSGHTGKDVVMGQETIISILIHTKTLEAFLLYAQDILVRM